MKSSQKRKSIMATLAIASVAFSCQDLAEETPISNDLGGGGSDTELTSVASVSYDFINDIYVAVGTSKSGDIDVYTGSQAAGWEKLAENRDIDNRYSPSEFVSLAFGSAEAGYGLAVGNKDGKGTSINARVFYDKPYFGDGAPKQIGSLTEVLSVEYDQTNDKFIAVGKNASGSIDVYVGYHNNWTQLQENRDIDNRYSPEQFVGVSFGAADGAYGVAIGNVADFKIGFRQTAPRATSINARSFYNNPWFGDGKPEAIGDLEEAYAVEYNPSNDNFVVVGRGPGGDI
ncbi:MAG: hypothetical protein ABJC55_01420, partial [Algoriphagus sp.]